MPGTVPPGGLDRFVERAVSLGIESKAFCIFSFLFGLGLAMQFERLSVQATPYRRLGRRLLVLLGFGLIHLFFVWNGDILTEYALAGLLVLPLLLLPTWVLAIGAMALFTLYALLPMLPPAVPWPATAAFASAVESARSLYPTGSYGQVLKVSWNELPLLLPLHVFVFPRTVALLLFGAFVWRTGVFQNPERHARLFASLALIGTVAGLALTYAAGAGSLDRWGPAGLILQASAPIVLATGYASVVLYLVRFAGAAPLLGRFSPVGRMAFTNYICQSLVGSLVFFGYGLGQFGRLGAAAVFLLGMGIYALQSVVSAYWLRHFRFGPLEWLWRTLMYGRVQPMRRTAGPESAAG